MTDLERRAESNGHGEVSTLVRWAEDARAAHQIATSLVKTSFVPEGFRNKPEEATAAILAGVEVGLSPMAALRSFDIIRGQAAPRAITLRAVAQAAGNEIWVDEQTDTRAVVCGIRKGSDKVQRSVWTMDRAKRLGLDQREQYKKQPGTMLVARATAEVCRLVASDAILGLPYAVEELDEGEEKPKKRTAQRKPLPPVEEPPLEPEPKPEAEQPEPEPELVGQGDDRPG